VTAEVPNPLLRPRLRGVSHQWAFFVSIGTGVALVLAAPTPKATVAAAIYGASVAALFGSSAIYHRVRWASAAARQWMRRIDHSMIFVLIAGTYTPFLLLSLGGTLGTAGLALIWGLALGGIVMQLVWVDAPRPVTAAVYIGLGWVAVIGMPVLAPAVGLAAIALVGAGGLLYTAGAVIYARRRPDPAPAVFGYHEIFHLLVIAAAALQFAAIAFYVIPKA
jgi:hemolysin III